jgi:hypothetical protein
VDLLALGDDIIQLPAMYFALAAATLTLITRNMAMIQAILGTTVPFPNSPFSDSTNFKMALVQLNTSLNVLDADAHVATPIFSTVPMI